MNICLQLYMDHIFHPMEPGCLLKIDARVDCIPARPSAWAGRRVSGRQMRGRPQPQRRKNCPDTRAAFIGGIPLGLTSSAAQLKFAIRSQIPGAVSRIVAGIETYSVGSGNNLSVEMVAIQIIERSRASVVLVSATSPSRTKRSGELAFSP
jgi:hypothetical protein